MTVRTEKIQSLTGSAPLTLPTSLPSSNKGLQVSTTGVISTPATATSLSGLSSGGNSDWILFDHLEQDTWATSMKVSANGNGSYAAGDIYCWEIKFHILHGRNGRNSMTGYWAPYSGDTNMTMFQSSQSLDQVGCGFYVSTQYYSNAGNPNANTSYDGHEFGLSQYGQDFNMSKNINYSNRFSSSDTPIQIEVLGQDPAAGKYHTMPTGADHTGGAIYNVAIQNASFNLSAGKENRYDYSLSFVATTRLDQHSSASAITYDQTNYSFTRGVNNEGLAGGRDGAGLADI